MASIDKRANGRYLARWREYPGAPQKTRTFHRKKDAERFLDHIRGDLARGLYLVLWGRESTSRLLREAPPGSLARPELHDRQVRAPPLAGNDVLGPEGGLKGPGKAVSEGKFHFGCQCQVRKFVGSEARNNVPEVLSDLVHGQSVAWHASTHSRRRGEGAQNAVSAGSPR